ncbi:urease accessory protein UreD [Deinococcus radiotolerans]|uniref:Urease accessory protein UreD n=1 Tax=Deinococcus radiotolerans TaxID=1309407 RepID=A0ABQ2FIA0_9DEIO|nr:urease accessory protein UreD [Deinococcus radiotolerans]
MAGSTGLTLLARTRTGVLHLNFGLRRGRTVLLRDIQKAPLMVIRPFELPCGTLMVFIMNPTGGVLGGDHAEIRAVVGEGARVLILTQAATRVQPAPDGRSATQDIHFAVAADGRLEYHPERTIPFAGSAFTQTLTAELEEGAQFGLTETLAAGRVQMGERLAFRSFESRVQVNVAGRRVYLDCQRLTPGDLTSAPGVWGPGEYQASGVFVGGVPGELPSSPGILASGVSAGGAVWVRGVASRGPVLDAVLVRARDSLRLTLWGAPPLQVRR